MADEFEYVKKAQRYRWKDSKKFVSQEVVDLLREKTIARKKTEIDESTTDMLSKSITVDAWERGFMDSLKEITIQLWQIGKPGEITLSDRGKLGNQLRFQYDRLWTFRQAIIDGKLSEAQIRNRAQLYLNKTRWAYEAARTQSHIDAGFLWERRIKPAKESCASCITYNALGWQPIGLLPEATEQCECMANCKCYKEYSDSPTMPENNSINPFNQLEWRLFAERNSSMKVNFDLPDIHNANQTQVEAAIAAAERAFHSSIALEANHNLYNYNSDQHSLALRETFGSRCRDRNNNNHQINRSNISNFIDREELSQILREVIAEQVMDDEELIEQSAYNFGIPTEEQFEKMQRFLPLGVRKKYKKESFLSAAFVASNNFLWHSKGAWSIKALATMTAQYPGRPFILDHDSWWVNRSRGLVYDAELVFNTAVKESILERVSYDDNYNILQSDGYVELIAFVMFQANHSHVEDLAFRRMGDVSTGSYIDPDSYMCPLDNTYFGEGDRWYQCAEGHNMPHPFLVSWYYNDDEMENLAPYYIIETVTDTIELSQVTMGNLPAATLILDR